MSSAEQLITTNSSALLLPDAIASVLPAKRSAAKILYGYILRLSAKGHSCFAGDEYLAKLMSWHSKSIVQRQLKILSRYSTGGVPLIERSSSRYSRSITPNFVLGRNTKNYIAIPAEVLILCRDCGLSYIAAVLYGVMWSHRNDKFSDFAKSNICYAMRSKLMQEAKINDYRTLQKSIDELAGAGCIEDYGADAYYPYIEYEMFVIPKFNQCTPMTGNL